MSEKIKADEVEVEVKEVKEVKGEKKSGKGAHCGWFFGGLAAGVAVVKALEGGSGKNGLAHVVAAVIRAKDATLERCGEDVPADIDDRAETIGMGALKFMLLKFNPKTTIMFDPQASVKFEGDTGPYVQYACTRINSIEAKAKELAVAHLMGELEKTGNNKEVRASNPTNPRV